MEVMSCIIIQTTQISIVLSGVFRNVKQPKTNQNRKNLKKRKNFIPFLIKDF